MDAGLEVQKLARQKQARFTPMQPQVVRRKADQHGAHAKVQPTRGAQVAHAGVDHREPGAAGAPGLEMVLVGRTDDGPLATGVTGAQTVVHARHIAPFDVRLVFKFLHEVAVPAQPARKPAQGVGQAALRFARLAARDGGLGRLVHGAHRDAAKGQVGTQPAAAALGTQGAGQSPPVAPRAALQKIVQVGPGCGLAGGWQRSAVAGQAQVGQGRQVRLRQRCARPAGVGVVCLGRVHARGPACGPAVACAQTAHHAGLRKLLPNHLVGLAPGGHVFVARVAPAGAGFFMAEKVAEREVAAQVAQHLGHFAHAHQQGQTARGQVAAQFAQADQGVVNLAAVAFRALQPSRLDDVNRRRAVAGPRGSQGRVVAPAQIAFEPDQGGGHSVDFVRGWLGVWASTNKSW